MTVFLSYGHDANKPLVYLIETDLRAAGHDAWRDRNRIKTGGDWCRTAALPDRGQRPGWTEQRGSRLTPSGSEVSRGWTGDVP